jgi:MFS family permease
VTRRIGYVRMLTLASVLLAVTIGTLVVAPNAVWVVIAVGLAGLLYGAFVPATASMIGLETPVEAQSTVFGFNASAVAFGFFLGPLIGGGIAATSDVRVALGVTAALSVGLAFLVLLGTREPRFERP